MLKVKGLAKYTAQRGENDLNRKAPNVRSGLVYRVGESNSAFHSFGFFGIDIHLVIFDLLKELLTFGDGFGHYFDY